MKDEQQYVESIVQCQPLIHLSELRIYIKVVSFKEKGSFRFALLLVAISCFYRGLDP
jgi:hypothetical protein